MVTVSLRRASPMSPSDRSEYHWGLTLLRSTNVISQFDYAYDAAGRRVSIAKSGTAFGDLSGSIDAYTYNTRSELTSARRTKNGQPIPGFSEDFDYDPIGNRRSSSTYNERGEAQTSTYQANNLNQYTSRTTPGYAAVRGEADPNAFVSINGNEAYRLGSYYFGSDLFDNTSAGGLANLETYAVLKEEKVGGGGDEDDDLVSAITNQVYLAQTPETFTYDDDGNQTLISTKTGLWRVTYNGENRPIRWVRDSDNTTIAMTYDHMGRRRKKNDQRFFYDGYLQVADNGGNTYAWDCTERVSTRPLSWLHSDSVAYYVHDGNKNVSGAVSSDGVLVAHYEYAPFGALTVSCGTSAEANPWRFSSEYADDEIGCDYFNFRHYEPVEGRWLNGDPLGEDGGVLLFAFCLNNPIGSNDFRGLSFLEDFQDAVKVVSGVALLHVSAGILVATSWSGIGAVGGVALAVYAADQIVLGGNNIAARYGMSCWKEDSSPIKIAYRNVSRTITSKERATVEKFFDDTYTAMEVYSSCYSGFVAAKTSVTAVKSVEWIPIHSEAVAYGERAAGTVTIRWRYELIEGAWDRKGVLMFYSTVIEGAASYVDAILSLGKVFDRINENRQGNRGDGNE